MTQALLLGAIGVIAETSHLQREAFNRAFAEADLPWHWSPEVYTQLLGKSGGQARIEETAAREGVHVDAPALHARKTEIFHDLLKDEQIRPRPGIAGSLIAARRAGWKTGFVTTTSRGNVDAILAAVADDLPDDAFDFIGDRSLVEHSKPAPDIYARALEDLGCEAGHAIAVEDSPDGAEAARAAGLSVVAFPGAAHLSRDFGEVMLRSDSLSPADLGLGESFDPANVHTLRAS